MPGMGHDQPACSNAPAQHLRTVAQLSVAAVAALLVAPIGVSDRSGPVVASSIATRAAKWIVAVETIDFDSVSECFTRHQPSADGLVRQQPLAVLAIETALTQSITITRIGSRHGP